ncbi:MAG TPA: ester cyclase [Polyangiaceae bacterium]|nr:ester cyclase [Polyangiaceae bacterium]
MTTKFSRILLCAALAGVYGCGGDDATLASGDLAADDREAPASETLPEARTLSRAEQVAVIERRLLATNTRDWDTWEALHTPDAIRTAPELEEPLHGAPAMRAAIEVLSTAFPDYHLELRQAISEGEWLSVRLHTTGTMTGPLLLSDGTEVPATGQPIEQDWSALVRFEGERIAQFDEYYDQLTLMVQLGLVAP